MLSWRVQLHAPPLITLSSPSSFSEFKFKFHPPRRKLRFSASASGDARCSVLSLDSKSKTDRNDFIGELMESLNHTTEEEEEEEDSGELDEEEEEEEEDKDDDREEEEEEEGHDDDDDDEDKQVVQVPRPKHIPVSKSQLLDAILLNLFQNDSEQDVFHFLQVSSCLDSILHAEHKHVLEEMRADYSAFMLPKAKDKDGHINDSKWRQPPSTSRVGAATRFQRAFLQLLSEAQFEELSSRDLMLTSALKTNYLLTLPIYVDWNKASDSNVIIFRRGYATERQKGLLLVDKLDYLQSKLLQKLFFIISKPLGKIATWMIQRLQSMYSIEQLKDWTNNMKQWLLEASDVEQLYLYKNKTYDGALEITDQELPIRFAAQRAVPRYEGFLSSAGPRGRLLRKLLTWTGLLPPPPETQFKLENDVNVSEPYLRPMFLSRISLGDIWKPARKNWFRKNLWEALKTSISILLSQSILQEAAFEELVLLYMNKVDERNVDDEPDIESLQLKIYEKIPIPDLPVIFPHKKLSFRIIDTVRLDAATMLGLLAYVINYKFEDILSSPSAIFLDVVAISALVIFISRVVLGYKQTWDRYQLLVNRTLYEKTLASGFGSVHFLLDASEQQQYKEAILAYAILLKANNNQAIVRQSIRDICEKFIYDMFGEKVDMTIDKAMDTLLRFGLVTETFVNGYSSLQAIPCAEAHKALTERWNSLLQSC